MNTDISSMIKPVSHNHDKEITLNAPPGSSEIHLVLVQTDPS